MQACQLCGAKSWGPVKDPESRALFMKDKLTTPDEYRECDACGQWALMEVVLGVSVAPFPGSHTVLGSPFGIAMMPGPSRSDTIEQATGILRDMGIGPKSYQTRTYELVRDMLSSGFLETDYFCINRSDIQYSSDAPEVTVAKAVLRFARAIEAELDQLAPEQLKQLTSGLKPRDFQKDFLVPLIATMQTEEGVQVALALDCAIIYGALEAQTGNESLKLSPVLESTYWNKVAKLHTLVS